MSIYIYIRISVSGASVVPQIIGCPFRIKHGSITVSLYKFLERNMKTIGSADFGHPPWLCKLTCHPGGFAPCGEVQCYPNR